MKKLLGCLVLVGVVGAATAASSDRWIHVRVDDADGGDGRVDIQVPVGMVASLLPLLKGAHANGSIRVNDASFKMSEFRDYWSAVRSAKDGEYVTVRDRDADVRIAKRGGLLLVNVDEKGGGGRVRMKVPVPLIDALLSSGDNLDFRALGGALAEAPEGELLTVDDEDSHVRIWIDGSAAPSREETR